MSHKNYSMQDIIPHVYFRTPILVIIKLSDFVLCTLAVCCSVRGHGRGDTALLSWSSRAATLSSIPSSHDIMSPWLLVNSAHHSRMSWRWPRASLASSDSLSTESVRERLTSTTWRVREGGRERGERENQYLPYFSKILALLIIWHPLSNDWKSCVYMWNRMRMQIEYWILIRQSLSNIVIICMPIFFRIQYFWRIIITT